MICFCAPRGLRFLPAATFAHGGEAADLQLDRSVLYLYHQMLKWDLAGGRTPASSVAVQHETKKSHDQSHDQPAQQAVVSWPAAALRFTGLYGFSQQNSTTYKQMLHVLSQLLSNPTHMKTGQTNQRDELRLKLKDCYSWSHPTICSAPSPYCK